MSTQKETRRLLCRSILIHLENQKLVVFPVEFRQKIQNELSDLLSSAIYTDEDLKEKVLTQLGSSVEERQALQSTENEQYQIAKKTIHSQFAQEELVGFYFQQSPKKVSQLIIQYLMKSPHIEEVYSTDEDLEHQIIGVIRKFNVNRLS